MARTVVITGANSGIGRSAAKDLAVKGYNVVTLCRNADQGESLVAELKRINPAIRSENFAVDLSNLSAVRTSAQSILVKYGTIDRLINNAGYYVSAIEYIDNIEKSFLSCHLGHMLLTQVLQPGLERSPEARVINISSIAHRAGSIARFFKRMDRYTPMEAYADLKLANILFTLALANELPSGITSYALHPGLVATRFSSGTFGFMNMLFRVFRPFLITPEKGASTIVFLADTDIQNLKSLSGRYFEKKRVRTTNNKDVSEANAAWLWKKSSEALRNPALYF